MSRGNKKGVTVKPVSKSGQYRTLSCMQCLDSFMERVEDASTRESATCPSCQARIVENDYRRVMDATEGSAVA